MAGCISGSYSRLIVVCQFQDLSAPLKKRRIVEQRYLCGTAMVLIVYFNKTGIGLNQFPMHIM